MDVTLLYFDSCPHWEAAAALIDRLTAELPDVEAHHHIVDNDTDAERLGFHGSPTILINGRDPWAPADAPMVMSCRMFTTPDGLRGTPTWEMLLAAVR